MIDYSQGGQALILEQLLTPATPPVVVDIGAHDGISGSNSRRLIELGWRAVLVEPLPVNFDQLVQNTRRFPNARFVQAACSDTDGTAELQIGRDGGNPQMSTLSQHPELSGNLSGQSIRVPTLTLNRIFSENDVPQDFGVLLVDTEGYDKVVLRGLTQTAARPRIIITEDFGVETEKYALLRSLDYRLVGQWAADSIWVGDWHRPGLENPAIPVLRLRNSWIPQGVNGGPVQGSFDGIEGGAVSGWIWDPEADPQRTETVVQFRSLAIGHSYWFQGWCVPRPDVSAHFANPGMLFTGFRTSINLLPGEYQVTVFLLRTDGYKFSDLGQISIP